MNSESAEHYYNLQNNTEEDSWNCSLVSVLYIHTRAIARAHTHTHTECLHPCQRLADWCSPRGGRGSPMTIVMCYTRTHTHAHRSWSCSPALPSLSEVRERARMAPRSDSLSVSHPLQRGGSKNIQVVCTYLASAADNQAADYLPVPCAR